jgi:hypothetical protein
VTTGGSLQIVTIGLLDPAGNRSLRLGAPMKTARVYLAAALVLLGIVAIPLSRAFDNDPIGDTIMRARVNVCLNTFNLCTTQCSARATAAPGSYSVCMQDCTFQYQRCMNGIGRAAPGVKVPGSGSPPSVASPGSTPRKVLPERVTNSEAAKPTSKANPTTAPSQARRIHAQRSKAPVTVTPREEQKKKE